MKLKIFCLTVSLLFIFFLVQIDSKASTYTMDPQIRFITTSNNIKEYRLLNGLKIILKTSHSIPLVTFSIWYKVGSRNEKTNIRGLAHFLEHMMFKGTKKFKKGEISQIIQDHGGVFNAFTSTDGTAYYEIISPKYLEKVIEIESDRLKGSILDESEINLEKTVVLSELEGNLNNPVTLLDEKLREIAYEVSPYKYPTIGYEEDIKNINSKTMRDFYTNFYNPNNATIVLVGDFNERNALNLINKYFGNIKNEATKPSEIPRDKKQTKEKKITVKRAGSFKILQIAYHITDIKNKHIYPLNILEEILIKGNNSRLNKSLIEKGLATEVSGGAEANTDPGLFTILISLTPKATHKKVEKIVLTEIESLIKTPPSEEEINAAKNRIKANYLFSLDGPFNQSVNLGWFDLTSNWKQSLEWTEEISKVTVKEINDALITYFQKDNRIIGYFIPIMHKGEKYEAQPLSLSKTHSYQATRVPTKAAKIENQKSKTENSQSNTNFFKFTKKPLSDGSELLINRNIDLPITYLSGVIKGGSSLLKKEKEVSCKLISQILQKGSKKFSKEEIKNTLDNTGSIIDFACDEESFKFNAQATNDNLKPTIELLYNILLNPTFPKKEVKIEKDKLIAEIIELKDNTREIAERRFVQTIYPNDHPYYSNKFDDDIKLIKSIKINDLYEAHEKVIKNNKAIISLTTNLHSDELNPIIKIIENNLSFKKDKNVGEINIPDITIREVPKRENIYLKDKLQSDVFLGHSGNLKRTDDDFYKIHIANYILGGSSLTSRLAKTVRDNAGLVYHVHSYLNATHGKGEFGIYFGSNNNNVDKAIDLIKDELQKFVKSGITQDELNKAKTSLIDSFVSRNLSTHKSIGNTILGIKFYNLADDYIMNYPEIINSLKLDEINYSIKNYFFPEKLNIAICGGDKKSNVK